MHRLGSAAQTDIAAPVWPGATARHLPAAALMATAILWGAGFVVTQIALDAGFSEGPAMMLRFGAAAVALLAAGGRRVFPVSRSELRCGALAGLLLFLGFYSQTAGQRLSTPSNCSLFTATSVIMVPFLAWAAHKRRPSPLLFLCAGVTMAGVAILGWSPGDGFAPGPGDALVLFAALCYACHITVLSGFSRKIPALRLTFLQTAFAALFFALAFSFSGRGALAGANWAKGLPAVLFLGLVCSCLCFFLQVWGQARCGAGKAAVIMAGEGLWGAVFSVAFGYEPLTGRMLAGGGMILGAVLLLESGVFLPRRGNGTAGNEGMEETGL